MSGTTPPAFTPFDELLKREAPVVLVGKQLLKIGTIEPDDKSAIVFPPSYANPSGSKDDPPVYNIDVLDPWDPSKNVCVIDSIPSQANRMEPLFGEPPNDKLIPQYKVKFNDDLPVFNITQLGHRLADAALRGTTLRGHIVNAFKAYAKGDASELARIGPTSLVFGAWDSRGVQVKVPRLINSIIRAFNVREIKRSAQYTPPVKYDQEGLVPAGLEGKPADHGLADVPSARTIGGVQIFGEIRRDFSLNLELLRELKGKDADETEKLQRYILGLSLLAFTATQKTYLRQGCQLLPKSEVVWRQFDAKGNDKSWNPDFDIKALADAAALAFVVKQPEDQPLKFEKASLKLSIETDAKKKADKKAGDEAELFAALRERVATLAPTASDELPNGKNGPLAELKKEIANIKKNKKASIAVKALAEKLEPLATPDVGAAARREQMLALFPAVEGISAEGSSETIEERSAEAAR